MERVYWYSSRGLHSVLDYVPPAQSENAYYPSSGPPEPEMSQP
ncbi:hypothetical protein [Mycobacterium sherrisii]|nr:hypothetical protein [Mycobacterium sherrisii]